MKSHANRLSLPQAILFDLDGTLADTAPDLAAAVNLLRRAQGLDHVPYERLRPHASAGARGLIGAAFGLKPGDHGYEELRDAFLDNYERALAKESQLFAGVHDMLDELQSLGIRWGIVTNKAMRFTNPLVPLIGLDQAACVISGDTTPHPKPHPAPLFEAARQLGLAPERCWYVGDDLRDIQAGQAAGMATIAAIWGYCANENPLHWNADTHAQRPLDLLDIISSAAS